MTKKTSEIRTRLENIAPIWKNLKKLVSEIDKVPGSERRDVIRFVIEGGFPRADGTRPVCRIRPSHRILLLAGSPCAVRFMTFSEALSALRTGCVESNALAAANERLLERVFTAFRPKNPSQRDAVMKIPGSLFSSVNFTGMTVRFPSFENKLFEAAMLDERGAFASVFARVFLTSGMHVAAKRMVDTLLFHFRNKNLSDDCVWSAHRNAAEFLERLLRTPEKLLNAANELAEPVVDLLTSERNEKIFDILNMVFRWDTMWWNTMNGDAPGIGERFPWMRKLTGYLFETSGKLFFPKDSKNGLMWWQPAHYKQKNAMKTFSYALGFAEREFDPDFWASCAGLFVDNALKKAAEARWAPDSGPDDPFGEDKLAREIAGLVCETVCQSVYHAMSPLSVVKKRLEDIESRRNAAARVVAKVLSVGFERDPKGILTAPLEMLGVFSRGHSRTLFRAELSFADLKLSSTDIQLAVDENERKTGDAESAARANFALAGHVFSSFIDDESFRIKTVHGRQDEKAAMLGFVAAFFESLAKSEAFGCGMSFPDSMEERSLFSLSAAHSMYAHAASAGILDGERAASVFSSKTWSELTEHLLSHGKFGKAAEEATAVAGAALAAGEDVDSDGGAPVL